MTEDGRLIGTALICFAAVAILGAYIVRKPLTPLDMAAIELRNRGTAVAIVFARSGYWPTLIVLNALLGVVELVVRGGIAFAVVLAATQLLSQGASDVTKELFRRVRPDDWLYHKELGFSYPSGHATTAVVFFGGLLFFVRMEPLSDAVQIAATVVIAIFMVGIPWSRMALAAHYASDVLGGLVFGIAWLCLMLVVLRHVPVTHIFL